jgi:hypothetical protein
VEAQTKDERITASDIACAAIFAATVAALMKAPAIFAALGVLL